MNKSKKELYEENKQLKKVLEIYKDFWECDALKIADKEKKIVRKALISVALILLLASFFLMGMVW